VLVADEAVSALDVSVQAQIVGLLRAMQAEHAFALMFITHDLRLAAELCDRVMVMHRGRVVESAPAIELFAAPRHPYTQSLLDAVPGRRAAGRHPAA
jgi:peptide/nickel transport system ATP-binding protein